MNRLIFEWDNEKNRLNQKKHGVSFEEAQSVFYDDRAIQFWDEENSEGEDRFLLLGRSYSNSRFAEVHLITDVVGAIHELPLRSRTPLYS
ncbi:MAG: BrnT family toxin, partial [Spirulina sp.]